MLMFITWGSRLAYRIFHRFVPTSPGFDSRFQHLCAFSFQFKLVCVGFPRVLRFSFLHLKLDLLNKSVSGVSWRRPLNLIPMCTFGIHLAFHRMLYYQTNKQTNKQRNKQTKMYKIISTKIHEYYSSRKISSERKARYNNLSLENINLWKNDRAWVKKILIRSLKMSPRKLWAKYMWVLWQWQINAFFFKVLYNVMVMPKLSKNFTQRPRYFFRFAQKLSTDNVCEIALISHWNDFSLIPLEKCAS